tara:strand:+ start:194 stop:838 length:645 start_codon:yes stop_codon:yes gene_type:complete
MSNDTSLKSKFFSVNAANTVTTAANTTNLAAEQDVADGAAVTLTNLKASFAGAGFAQKLQFVSGNNDDNSGVTFTIVGTDSNDAVITEDLVGGAGGVTVVTTLFYNTLTSVTGNGAATVDVSIGTLAGNANIDSTVFAGRTRVRGYHGVTKVGTLILTNTSNAGLITLRMQTIADQFDPYVPDNGTLFNQGCFISLSQTAIGAAGNGLTIFFDG